MSMWVRALAQKPLGDVTPEELHAGIARWLPRLAAIYGEDGDEATIARLGVDGAAPLRGGAITYGSDGASIRFERTIDPTDVKRGAAELASAISDCDEDGVDDVREMLDQVVEIAKIEVSLSDCEGVGWPVAIAAAAYLAERGEGIVQADGEGFMVPSEGAMEHVLDGD